MDSESDDYDHDDRDHGGVHSADSAEPNMDTLWRWNPNPKYH